MRLTIVGLIFYLYLCTINKNIMIDQIFNLLHAALQASPTLSILLGFALAGFLAFIFQDVIKDYVKKKYNLHSDAEVVRALNQAATERQFYSKTSENLTPTVQDRIITILKRNKNPQ